MEVTGEVETVQKLELGLKVEATCILLPAMSPS